MLITIPQEKLYQGFTKILSVTPQSCTIFLDDNILVVAYRTQEYTFTFLDEKTALTYFIMLDYALQGFNEIANPELF